MKRKTIRIILVFALIITALPITTAPAALAGAPAEATLAAAYKAYYDVLKTALNEINETDCEFDEYKMTGAKLFDFNNDGIPELMYSTWFSYGGYIEESACVIYGYSEGAQCYGSYSNGYGEWVYSSYSIVTDKNGVSYINTTEVALNPISDETGTTVDAEEVNRADEYFTVRNGKWVEVPADEIEIVSEQDLSWSRTPSTVDAVLAMLQSAPTVAPPTPPALDALPSAWSLNVNGGTLRGTDMYNIGGSNYLKIRDIAALLDGTDKQFNITVDGRTVNLIPGAAYDARGDEMAANPNAVQTKTSVTTFDFTLEGKPIELTAYMIAGSNYVKIRDVLRLFDVYVDYDASLREFYIDTAKAYVDN